jgi:excisionase family DNA binding protein
MSGRFLSRAEVAEQLNVTEAHVYALIRRRGELRAAKIGGRGVYRVGGDDLEDYIARAYEETARWMGERPFTGREPPED